MLAGILEAGTAIPYIRDIRRGKTKPAIVSWMTWMVLSGIAGSAAFAEGAYAGAVIGLALTFESFVIVIFSIGKGHITYTKFDGFCQAGAMVGLLAWYITNDPTAAIICFVATDIIGAIPTFLHAWRRPAEETLITYSISILANSIALITIQVYTLADTLIPAYLLIFNTVITSILLLRKKTA